MPKPKIKILLVGLLLIATLCVYRWWSAGATIQRAVANNGHLLKRDIDSYMFWRGESAFRNWLSTESATNDALTYDGENRLAYVIRCTNPLYQGNSDSIQFRIVGGPHIGLVWTGSPGMRVCAVQFVGGSVRVGIATEADPKQKQGTAEVPWHSIESMSGTGQFGDYLKGQ